ncbi:hypothetical protein QR680_009786 [Steinernema hermaphroditum]|uniref:Uncharacterized protein n=1 Tax=Steinernema hermaphroditum TaxID=289476 RepID=A0AA39MAJ7_9BILA|nr:hypothetical protein QR680_009786 [Steinernema hermaphroditum]
MATHVVTVITDSLPLVAGVPTLIFLWNIFSKVAIAKIARDSQLLALLLLGVVVSAISHIPNAVLWLLFGTGLLPNSLELQWCLLMGAMVTHCTSVFYDLCGIGLIIHRVAVFWSPLVSSKRWVKPIVWVMVVLSVLFSIILVAVDIVYTKADLHYSQVHLECLSMNCLVQADSTNRVVFVIIKLITSVAHVGFGIAFLILIRTAELFHKTSTFHKINGFVKYLFFIRVVFEIVPFLIDCILSITIKFSLIYYVGAYSKFGWSVDALATAVLYYLMMERKTNNVSCSQNTPLS